jgi:hypothetical protein
MRCLATVLLCLGALPTACATTARPAELAQAEQAYLHAVRDDAGQFAPIDLEAAHVALDGAERAFAANDVNAARDMAYVAQRRAELAEARADESRDLGLEGSVPASPVVAP